MLNRCRNPKDARYKDYGGRGITVCKEWEASFSQFLVDVGPKPSPEHSIDRIDTDGSYEPNNVRWSTPVEQARNKRNTEMTEVDGVRMPVIEACERYGVGYGSVNVIASREGKTYDSVFHDLLTGKRRRERPGIRAIQRLMRANPDPEFHAKMRAVTVGTPGVTWDKGKLKYLCQFKRDGRIVSKCFDTFEQAREARLAAERGLHAGLAASARPTPSTSGSEPLS